MRLKDKLPKSCLDITLSEYQQIDNLKDDNGIYEYYINVISILTKLSIEEIKTHDIIELEACMSQINTALDEKTEIKYFFDINGVLFGMIPNLDKMTAGEYLDLVTYSEKGVEGLHKFMAVLFRPVKTKKKSGYMIEEYKGADMYSDLMLNIPLRYVNSALAFFLALASALSVYTPKFLEAQQKRGQNQNNILVNGGGIQ